MTNNFHPCPFCGGKAELIIIPSVDGAENAGGSYVGCPSCGASSAVVFGEKQGLEERWNRRAARASGQGGGLREAYPVANEKESALGWSFAYDFLCKISDATRASGEYVCMEGVEAVIRALLVEYGVYCTEHGIDPGPIGLEEADLKEY